MRCVNKIFSFQLGRVLGKKELGLKRVGFRGKRGTCVVWGWESEKKRIRVSNLMH